MTVWLVAEHADGRAHAQALLAQWPAAGARPVLVRSAHDVATAPPARQFVAFTSRTAPSPIARDLAVTHPGLPWSVVQDYWGDVLELPGVQARYFVRDALAARRTSAHAQVRDVHVTGAPRHAAPPPMEVQAARTEARAGLPDGASALLWLGQAPAARDAYFRNLEVVADVFAALPRASVWYRPHTRESADAVAATEAKFQRRGLHVQRRLEQPLWRLLAASDLVTSCFSQAGVEAVYLNRAAPAAFNRTLFVLADAELQAYHRHHDGDAVPPLAAQGLALAAADAEQCASAVRQGLDSAGLRRFSAGPLQTLVPGEVAAATIAMQLAQA